MRKSPQDPDSECKDSITVCFNTQGCSINVYGLCSSGDCSNEFENGYVEKSSEKMYYAGDALLYGAIFSSTDIYSCNFKRLMYRISKLSEVYSKKADLLKQKGCGMGSIQEKLSELSLLAGAVKQENVNSLQDLAKQVQQVNDELTCRLW